MLKEKCPITRGVTGRTFSYAGEKNQILEGVENTNSGVRVRGIAATFFTGALTVNTSCVVDLQYCSRCVDPSYSWHLDSSARTVNRKHFSSYSGRRPMRSRKHPKSLKILVDGVNRFVQLFYFKSSIKWV